MALTQGQETVTPAGGRWTQRLRRFSFPLFVFLLLLVALGVRLYGIDWDQGSLFHPDERAILMKVGEMRFPTDDLGLLLRADESPWNPRWFPYGSYPLYQLKVAQLLTSSLTDVTFGDLRLIGRALSAVADVGTVVLVLLLGTRLFGRRTGVLAALLVAFSVIHIQLSHFYTVETFFTLFIALALLFLLHVVEGGRPRDSALAGVFGGLALATKVSAAPVLGAVAVAHLLYAFSATGQRFSFRWPSGRHLTRALAGGALAGGVAGLTFFLAAPYAVLDWGRFLGDVLYQGSMVTREADLPYTRQYVDTVPYWYHLQQLSVWGLGLPLGVVAWAGLAFAVVGLWWSRHKGLMLLLTWVLAYFIITGSFEVKFLRYLLPITPFLVLLGAHLLVRAMDGVAARWPRRFPLAQGAVLLVTVATAFYAFAYLGIYTQPHTAIRASQWVRDNVPTEARLLSEHWEEGLPNLQGYQLQALPMYEADTPEKRQLLAQALAQGDYLVFYSNRLYGTIPRLPERYPMSTRYYRALFAGELGYQLAHWERSYPSLLGVALVDDTFARPGLPVPVPLGDAPPAPVSLGLGYADESFTVYDHPMVLIFQNVQRWDEGYILGLLTASPGGEAGTGSPSPEELGPETPLGLMLTPSEVEAQQEGGTWREIIHPDGLGSRLLPWSWLLLLIVMAGLVLPVVLLVFRRLPDGGFLLAKPLGILVVSYLTWLLASLKVAPFSPLTVVLVMVVVGGVSLGVGYRQRGRLLAMARERWRLWFLGEAIFLVAFLGFLLVRMANPDLWHPWRGGEKFMELAYLTAVAKSTFMPPYDPWFAEGYLNYYYFGFFIIATFIKVLGVAPATAFNLAVPLVFALTVGGVFSLGYNLVARARSGEGRGWVSRQAVGVGLVGVLSVAVLGNLDGAAQVLQGAWRVLAQGGSFSAFDYWRSSRMMPPDPPGFEVTEFPYWSFLFADLHPHVMAIPFAVLALGIALAVFLGLRRSWSAGLLPLAVLPLALGVLWPLNTWDFPTYAGIAVAALGLGLVARMGPRPHTVGIAALLGVLVVLLSYLLFLPFHLRYQGFSNGLVLSETQTALWQYLGIHGLFVFVIVSYLLKEAWPRLYSVLRSLAASAFPRAPSGLLPSHAPPTAPDDLPAQADAVEGSAPSLLAASAAEPPSSRLARVPREAWVVAAGGTGVLAVAVALAALGYTVVAVLAALLGLAAYLLLDGALAERGDSPATLFVLLLLGVGLAIGAGVDLVTVKNDIGRMNTVFKFYEQAWVLLGVASAYFLWRLRFGMTLAAIWRRIPRGTWMAVLGLLFLATAVFPVLGTRARLEDRFQALPLTLDGMAYMREAVYHDSTGGELTLRWDLEAIHWLQENVDGSPVVLEGVTPLYRWGNRISVYTGLPAIVGWDWHQTQQRGIYHPEVQRRRMVVNLLYTTTSQQEALGLLQEYRVRYIVVGELERLYYPAEGVAKFAAMDGDSLERVFHAGPEGGGVTIYRVME